MKIKSECRESAHPEAVISQSNFNDIRHHLKSTSVSNRLAYYQSHQSHQMFPRDIKKMKISPIPQQITTKNERLRTREGKQHVRACSNQRLTTKVERNHYIELPNSGKRTLSIKQYLVEHENKKLMEAIKSHELDKKQYKRKLATEVDDYLKLRQHLHKFKKNFTLVLSKGQALKTERDKSLEFRNFLATSIQETKQKMRQKQFFTERADY